MRQQQRGFTLIELMIVVMIIGLLASVALPAYQDYTARAKMSEVVLAASACRSSISEVYAGGGAPPGANAWGCEGGSSQYVQNVTTDADGVITATAWNISPDVDGKRLILAPFVGGLPADSATMMGQSISEWRCGPAPSNGVSLRHLPAGCRGS
jgi:type IV pilus assembly protein PilA